MHAEVLSSIELSLVQQWVVIGSFSRMPGSKIYGAIVSDQSIGSDLALDKRKRAMNTTSLQYNTSSQLLNFSIASPWESFVYCLFV